MGGESVLIGMLRAYERHHGVCRVGQDKRLQGRPISSRYPVHIDQEDIAQVLVPCLLHRRH